MSSSRLLINEPPLLILPSLAATIGLNEAIFVQQLHYWTSSPHAREVEGQRWIYNTYEAWGLQFPFWSHNTVRRVVERLENSGIIETTARFNRRSGDRTKWYAIRYDKLERLAERAEQLPKMGGATAQGGPTEMPKMGSPLPETTQRLPTETSPPLTRGGDGSAFAAPRNAQEWMVETVRRLSAAGLTLPSSSRAGHISSWNSLLSKGVPEVELHRTLNRIVGRAQEPGGRILIPSQAHSDIVGDIPGRAGRTESGAEGSPAAVVEALRSYDNNGRRDLREFAYVAERWDFTREEEPPFKIMARLGNTDEERGGILRRLRSVAQRTTREASAGQNGGAA